MPTSQHTRLYSRSRISATTSLSPTSSQTDLTSSPPPTQRKRALSDASSIGSSPPSKRRKAVSGLSLKSYSTKSATSTTLPKAKQKQSALTQLHLLPDQSVLRECKLCGLSYTRAAAEDERLHKAHCVRVRRGTEWGRDDERALSSGDLMEIAKGIRLKSGKAGRVISFRGDLSGKLGRKLATLLETVNLALSSPSLTTEALKASKVYLFLLPSLVPSRESIVGVVIAQRITTAMAVVSVEASPDTKLIPVHIDPTTSLYLDPTPLPTPLGISRLFVSSTHRRQGIAHHLLEKTVKTFLYGCELDPGAGEVAFSQPTAMGRAVMETWGGGGVRIYEE